jgi:hypothetical protein
MQVRIRTIPHEGQRYPTTGDHRIFTGQAIQGSFDIDDVLEVTVSCMGDWRYEMLVGVHELVESLLCKKNGVKEESIDRFDMLYEDAREKNRDFFPCGCAMSATSEPGDDIHSPYRHEHRAATLVEQFLAEKLGVDWTQYEAANLALYEKPAQEDLA